MKVQYLNILRFLNNMDVIEYLKNIIEQGSHLQILSRKLFESFFWKRHRSGNTPPLFRNP